MGIVAAVLAVALALLGSTVAVAANCPTSGGCLQEFVGDFGAPVSGSATGASLFSDSFSATVLGSVPQFDSLGGARTLLRVELHWDSTLGGPTPVAYDVLSSLSITNPTGNLADNGGANVSATGQIFLFGLERDSETVNPSGACAPIAAGQTKLCQQASTDVDGIFARLLGAPELLYFIGGGTVPVALVGSGTAAGSSNASGLSFTHDWTVGFNELFVIYGYCDVGFTVGGSPCPASVSGIAPPGALPTPEPASLWLLASGLATLTAAVARRHSRR